MGGRRVVYGGKQTARRADPTIFDCGGDCPHRVGAYVSRTDKYEKLGHPLNFFACNRPWLDVRYS